MSYTPKPTKKFSFSTIIGTLCIRIISIICIIKGFYTTLLTKCELNRYLADVNKQAEDMFFRLIKQMAEREGVTEKLKSDNQMEWVARMNNIRSRATEIVNHDIIYN